MSGFSHRDHIENHYPITVMERVFDDVAPLNEALFELILDLDRRFHDSDDNAVRQGQVSTQGGYQTSTRMNLMTVKSAAIDRLRDELLMPAIRDYLATVFEGESDKLDPWPVGWANLLSPGDWQGPHFHPTPDNLASGVYYVRLPGDRPNPEGRIEFINPIPISVHHGYSSTRRLHPTEGKLVLFPPWYMHYVHPFGGERQRAVIAFDVLARKPGFQLVL